MPPSPIDVDQCQHSEFSAKVEVHRITDDAGEVKNILAEVSVRCVSCDVPFRFLGPPTGLSFAHPTVDVAATMLHCPIAPGERGAAEIPSTIRFEVD